MVDNAFETLAKSAVPYVKDVILKFQAELDKFDIEVPTETGQAFVENIRNVLSSYLNDILAKIVMADQTSQTWWTKLFGILKDYLPG